MRGTEMVVQQQGIWLGYIMIETGMVWGSRSFNG